MENLNNPAGRLLVLLRAGRDKKKHNLPAVDVWSDLLNVPVDDKTRLLREIGRVFQIPALIRSRIEQIPTVDPIVYLKWLPKLEQAFIVSTLAGPWRGCIDYVDDVAIYGIEVCDELLSRHSREKTLPRDQLDNLLRDTESLVHEVADCSIDEDLRQYILKHLEIVDRAIRDYILHGAQPLQEAVEAAVGSLVLNQETYKRTSETEVGGKFWKVMGRALMLVGITAATIQIGKDVVKLLPEPDAEVEATSPNSAEVIDAEFSPKETSK